MERACNGSEENVCGGARRREEQCNDQVCLKEELKTLILLLWCCQI